MRLRVTVDGGESVVLDVEAGVNVWLDAEDVPGEPWERVVGSLYLSNDGRTLTLGRYSEDEGQWEPENDLPVPAATDGANATEES